MQTKPFFQTALSLSLALTLSACAIHSADQNLTLESTGQVMSAAEAAERYDVNG
ncbi:MAG: TolC family protein, partial [Neisseria sp.]|nr:TolC family protein [Neisseria sp.]